MLYITTTISQRSAPVLVYHLTLRLTQEHVAVYQNLTRVGDERNTDYRFFCKYVAAKQLNSIYDLRQLTTTSYEGAFKLNTFIYL